MNVEAVFFDFDGVLVESVDIKTKAFAYLFEEFGRNVVKEVVQYHISHGGVSRVEKFKYYYDKILNKPLGEEKLNRLCKEFSGLVLRSVISAPYVRGAKEFLDNYYNKIDLYVISGTPQDEMRYIVKQRGMERYFKEVLGTPAKKGELAEKLVDRCGYDRTKVYFIGDSIDDMEGANEAGIVFIGKATKDDQDMFPRRKVIHDLSQLEKILGLERE